MHDIDTAMALGRSHYESGDYRASEVAYRWVLHLEPRNVTALLLLADAEIQQNVPGRAVTSVRQALAIQRDNAIAYFALGRALHLNGEGSAAAEAYRNAVNQQPSFALAYSNLALVLIELDDYQGAVAAAKLAIGLVPELVDAHIAIGRVFLKARRLAEAERALRDALSLDPDETLALNTLGRTLQMIGRWEEAIACHQRAIELAPNGVFGWNGVGLVLRALGRFDEASIYYRRAIEIDPNFGDAHNGLAVCAAIEIEKSQMEKMREVLFNPNISRSYRASAGFGLGKNLDDNGQFDEAFSAYCEANRLTRELAEEKGLYYDNKSIENDVSNIIESFGTAFFKKAVRSSVASDLPVFVVGLYRSGTTLTEQILASHPEIFGAGELFNIRHLSKEILPFPSLVANLSERTLKVAAERHVKFLTSISNGTPRVVDKHPDNIFSLGIIAMLFPNAKVIICHRDPRDNVLSCYFQAFVEGMTFSTDMRDCADRYVQTRRLAEHWRETLPLKILEVQYERLVDDLESQARRMIDFLGLEWNPVCLKFFETERIVNTPSMWQVRQPIYQTSVGRWRNYERHLAPLLGMLRERGIV